MPDFNLVLFLDYSILRGFGHLRFPINTSLLNIFPFQYRIYKLHPKAGDWASKDM
jgi:hypothetical protein